MYVSLHWFMPGAFREQKRCLVSRHGCWEPNMVLCKNQCPHCRAHSPATEVSILMQGSQTLFSITIYVTKIYFQNCNFWYCYDEHFWIHNFFVYCFGSIFKVPSPAYAVACVEGSKLVVFFSVIRLCSAPSSDHPRAPFFFLIIFGDKVSPLPCNPGLTPDLWHSSFLRLQSVKVTGVSLC